MILIACVDDKFGMLFNRRRQSQDRMLRERVLRLTDGKIVEDREQEVDWL